MHYIYIIYIYVYLLPKTHLHFLLETMDLLRFDGSLKSTDPPGSTRIHLSGHWTRDGRFARPASSVSLAANMGISYGNLGRKWSDSRTPII